MTMHFMDTGKIERENELDERVQYYRRRVFIAVQINKKGF